MKKNKLKIFGLSIAIFASLLSFVFLYTTQKDILPSQEVANWEIEDAAYAPKLDIVSKVVKFVFEFPPEY